MAKVSGKSLSDIKGYAREKSWDKDLGVVDIQKEYPGKAVEIRLGGKFYSFLMHWINTKPDDMGKNYKEKTGSAFPVWCPDWDSEAEQSTAETCLVCTDYSSKEKLGRGQVRWYVNGFMRKKKKDGSSSWSECTAFVLPAGAIAEIKTVMETAGNGIEPQHKNDGYSLWFKYDDSQKPAKWNVQKATDIPLKKIKTYSKEDLIDFSEYFKPTSAESIEESLKRCGYFDKKKKGSKGEDEDEDDFDEDEKPKKKKKHSDEDEDEDEEDEKPSKKKKGKKVDDDDDDDDSDEDESDDDSDDEDEKPSKKKKKGKKDDDEDDLDFDDEDDEDDDEKPKKKKKGKKEDDDDDDDLDFDDDDDDEDEKPSKKKKKKKKHSDDDDD